MNARQFKSFLDSVTKLTAGQLEQVQSALATEHTERASYQAIETARQGAVRRVRAMREKGPHGSGCGG